MAKEMQFRHAALLAVLASFAIYLSPLPVHGGVTTIGLMLWQESGKTPGPLGGLRSDMLATVLVFQALLGLLAYWTLRRPNRSRVVRLLMSLPVVATLFVIALFAVARARLF
jgi:hypothetical protein